MSLEYQIGQVVYSKSGHDQGDVQMICAIEGEYLLLADGKERPLERPKRKRRIHLSVTGTVLEGYSLRSNRELRRALQQL